MNSYKYYFINTITLYLLDNQQKTVGKNMHNNITAVYLIRNEENFIKDSILSIAEFVDEIIVFDTGSKDKTVEMLKSLDMPKIKLHELGEQNPQQLGMLRNKMIDLVKTDWFWLVDGDEIYGDDAYLVKDKIKTIPENIHRLQIKVIDLIKNPNLVYSKYVGKIFRAKKIMFAGEYPFENPVCKDDKNIDLNSISAKLDSQIRCFHMCYFPRSSKDLEVKYGRHWRRLPFPLQLYFGPWPKSIKNKFNPSNNLTIKLILIYLLTYFRVLADRLAVKITRENPSKKLVRKIS